MGYCTIKTIKKNEDFEYTFSSSNNSTSIYRLQSTISPYSLNAYQEGFRLRIEQSDTLGQFYGINLEMKANKDSLPPFYILGCNWKRCVTISDSSYIVSNQDDCPNLMTTCKLGKDETLTHRIVLYKPSLDLKLPNKNVRVGISIIPPSEHPYGEYGSDEWRNWNSRYDSIKNLESKSRIVWSNEVELKETENAEIKITNYYKKVRNR